MKLISRYNRTYILSHIIVLLISSVTYYFIIRHILINQLDRDLRVEESEIIDYVKEKNALPPASNYKGQEIKFEKAAPGYTQRKVESITRFDSNENEYDPMRQLSFPIVVNGQLHKAMVIKSQLEAEDLLKLIVKVTAGVFLLLLVINLFINRFVLGKLWQPFFLTLNRLKEFKLNTSNNIELPASNINEFQQLNQSVVEMTTRVSKEYETLKAFTDNASHEMQTPLAIISSKLDLLIQSSSENQADQLQAIYAATSRLTKLNQTLLLLTRIDNHQFVHEGEVNFKVLMQTKLHQFEELLLAKSITVSATLEDCYFSINKELADILINNLLSNAIKHNVNGGTITCIVNSEGLILKNTGKPLLFDENQIFDRFKKSDASDGNGLGLAVAKQICESSALNFAYRFQQNEHIFVVSSNSSSASLQN